MRKLIILLAIAFTFTANAQVKGDWYVGTGDVANVAWTEWSISPTVGYGFTDNLMVGLNVSQADSSEDMGFDVHARYFFGEKKFFGPLEIKALKCQLSENNDFTDAIAYLQVKDLSAKDNNQVFLFNGWTFASSPTLQSIDHPIYDLWITSCENI